RLKLATRAITMTCRNALAQSGHRLVRCTCPLLVDSEAHTITPLMFGVGIGHNAKRRIERQLFFQRLAESITLTAQLIILRFQCRQLLQLLLLHLGGVIELAAKLATLPLQACQLLSKLGEELER